MTDAVKPDTSEAAVERDAATVEHFARVWPEDAEESVRDAMRNSLVHISALLRALLAERDALRAQLTEAKEALQPFAFLARVNARLNLDPELPLKDFVPGVWPKWKDVQRALAALREAGHE